MEASREVEGHPSLRKACGVIVRDALFLSLLGDPHSRLLAEERMSEASVPHFPLSCAEFIQGVMILHCSGTNVSERHRAVFHAPVLGPWLGWALEGPGFPNLVTGGAQTWS